MPARLPEDDPPSEYTLVFPPTMLWANFQRPHHLLTQIARRHPVRCLFNDWTVREERLEGGRLIVTRRAFRSRYHSGPLVYYCSIPDKLDYLRRHRLKPDLVVFELMDLPEEEFERWQGTLPEALRRADIVRTTGPAITAYLQERHAHDLDGKPVSTSRNGVDLQLFDPARVRAAPTELAHVSKPILGFYGNLDWWIDWALVERLAALPEYQVVLIGDTEGRRDRIPASVRASSAMWLGRRSVTELPGYLARFSVALFPFLVNDMTDAVDPLKVWEYFAFGKPVLATPTAFVRERSGLFEVVDGAAHDETLAHAVSRALRSGLDEQAAAARRSAADERDWGVIADELHAEIRGALAARE